ncbi:MAG: MFS transporter [Sporolactobacillus sp.]
MAERVILGKSLHEQSRRQIFKTVCSGFIGSFSASFINFAISLYILKLTGSAVSFGVTLLIGPALGLIFAPVIGYVADRFEHKRLMATSQLTCMALLVIYAVLFLWVGHGPAAYPLVLVLVGTLGINMRFFQLVFQASVSQLVEESLIQRLNSLQQSASALANIAGPVAAGALFAFVPFSFFVSFEIVAELSVILIVITLNFHLMQLRAAEHSAAETMWQSLKGGLMFVRSRPLLIFMIAAGSLLNFLFGVFVVGFPYIIVHILKLSGLQYSVTEALFSAGLVIGGLLATQLRETADGVKVAVRALFVAGFPLIFAIIPLMVTMNGWAAMTVFGAVYVVVAAAIVFVNVPIQTYIQKTVPADYQGRVFTIIMAGATSLQPLGMFVYGVLFQTLPPVPIMIASCLGFLVIAVCGALVRRKSSMVYSVTGRPSADD